MSLIPDKDYTYQDLAREWCVSATTVKRWFAGVPGMFCPTRRTIRIPGLIAINFYKLHTSANGKKIRASKQFPPAVHQRQAKR